jgi:hypothetical protein
MTTPNMSRRKTIPARAFPRAIKIAVPEIAPT